MRVALPICWCLSTALWIGIASTVSASEILAGVSAGLIATAAFGIAVRVLNVDPSLRCAVSCCRKLFPAIPAEIAGVVTLLVSSRSQSSEYPFERGISRFRPLEFLVVLFGSFTPDSVVIDVDGGRRSVTIHQMKSRRVPDAVRCLGVR